MIEINGIYKNFRAKEILKGIDLVINEGQTLTIIGISGSGKSVILKHIAGLLSPDKGDIKIDDKSIVNIKKNELFNIQRQFGILFQGAALFDSLTTGQNVAFGVRNMFNLTEKEIDKLVDEKLEMVGLSIDTKHLKPAELSGGMKKRVALARAIAYNPKYILYDEPTTGLDPITSEVINDLIISLQQNLNITSIVVTHDMHSAYKVSDRIAMLDNGKIIEDGTPNEIKMTSNPRVREFIRI